MGGDHGWLASPRICDELVVVAVGFRRSSVGSCGGSTESGRIRYSVQFRSVRARVTLLGLVAVADLADC